MPKGAGDERQLDVHHGDDGEPQGVEAQGADHGEEDRHGYEHDGDGLHERAHDEDDDLHAGDDDPR